MSTYRPRLNVNNLLDEFLTETQSFGSKMSFTMLKASLQRITERAVQLNDPILLYELDQLMLLDAYASQFEAANAAVEARENGPSFASLEADAQEARKEGRFLEAGSLYIKASLVSTNPHGRSAMESFARTCMGEYHRKQMTG